MIRALMSHAQSVRTLPLGSALIWALLACGCSSPAEPPANSKVIEQPAEQRPKTREDCEAVCTCAWASPMLVLRDAATHGPIVGFGESSPIEITITGADRSELAREVECWTVEDSVQCRLPDLEPGKIEIALAVPGYADKTLTTEAKYEAPGDPCCPCDMAFWIEPNAIELDAITTGPSH